MCNLGRSTYIYDPPTLLTLTDLSVHNNVRLLTVTLCQEHRLRLLFWAAHLLALAPGKPCLFKLLVII